MATRIDEQTLFDPIAFGAQIAARRKALRIPQDKLAEAVGISRVQLQNLEIGLSDRSKGTPANPRLRTLIGLCRELHGRIDLAYPGGAVIVFEPHEAQ